MALVRKEAFGASTIPVHSWYIFVIVAHEGVDAPEIGHVPDPPWNNARASTGIEKKDFLTLAWRPRWH